MPVNPYERLKEQFRDFASECEYRRKIDMFVIDKTGSYSFGDVYERILAADQLGYDVSMTAKDGKIYIKYIKKLPERPWVVR